MEKKIILLVPSLLFSIMVASCKSDVEKLPGRDNNTYEKQKNESINYNNTTNYWEYISKYGNNTDNSEKIIKDNVFLGEENFGGLKESEALERIKNKARIIDKEPVNAVLDSHTWMLEKKEEYGKKVDVQETLEMLINAPAGKKVELVVDEIKPGVTSKRLKDNIDVIGSYTTVLLDDSESRVNNISIACETLDYEKVQPGEEFSINDALGRRTKDKGYEKAPIIKKTASGPKRVYGYGGGICQISSTMYNAVRESGLKVTERHSHSKDVKYVPKGMDATVAFGSSDFKFVNNRKYPVMIRLYLEDKSLTVKIIENRN